jgi:hypothetical protein
LLKLYNDEARAMRLRYPLNLSILTRGSWYIVHEKRIACAKLHVKMQCWKPSKCCPMNWPRSIGIAFECRSQRSDGGSAPLEVAKFEWYENRVVVYRCRSMGRQVSTTVLAGSARMQRRARRRRMSLQSRLLATLYRTTSSTRPMMRCWSEVEGRV